jgi:hypothetical protein
MTVSIADVRAVALALAIDVTEMRELVQDAWSMVVPDRVVAEYLARHPISRPVA